MIISWSFLHLHKQLFLTHTRLTKIMCNLLKLILFLTILHHLPTKLFAISSTPLFPKESRPTKSGYLQVNTTTGSAMFYTFYEAQNPTSSLSQTPLLVWLQGGPGCSSMVGNFFELGPWRVVSSHRQNVESLSVEPNPGSWNRLFGLLFLDNPIGVGFSIASTPHEIPRDQQAIAKHLFNAIKAFIALDPMFKYRPIYFTGESYAGKYVPAIGYYILNRNSQLPVSSRVNLAGIAIGNGMTDPPIQVAAHADNAYYSGLINQKQRTELEKVQVEAVALTKTGNWSEARSARNKVLRLLQNMTGLATLFDYRRLVPYEESLVDKFLSNVEVKKALGVNASFVYERCSDVVQKALHEDVMKSAKYMVEFLIKNTKVMLYQGQCDLSDSVVSTEAWVKTMKWEGIEKFTEAERKIWKVNGKLAGYVQKWGSLSQVVVLAAGHLVPADQAMNSQAMIEDWVQERGLFASE